MQKSNKRDIYSDDDDDDDVIFLSSSTSRNSPQKKQKKKIVKLHELHQLHELDELDDEKKKNKKEGEGVVVLPSFKQRLKLVPWFLNHIMLPRKIETDNKKDFYYAWPLLDVRPDPHRIKGDCVFAKEALPPFTFIPYLGVMYPEDLFPRSFLDWVANSSSYVHRGQIQQDEFILIDGDPKFYPHNRIGCKGLAIAAKINEPSPNQGPSNCVYIDHASIHIPLKGSVFVVTTRLIAAGEELTVCYGSKFARDYSVYRECAEEPKMNAPLKKFVTDRVASLYDLSKTLAAAWREI